MFFVFIPEIDARAPLTLQSIAVLLYYLMNFPTWFWADRIEDMIHCWRLTVENREKNYKLLGKIETRLES